MRLVVQFHSVDDKNLRRCILLSPLCQTTEGSVVNAQAHDENCFPHPNPLRYGVFSRSTTYAAFHTDALLLS